MIFFKSTSYKTLSKLVNIIFKNKILTRMCTHVSRQIKSNKKKLTYYKNRVFKFKVVWDTYPC